VSIGGRRSTGLAARRRYGRSTNARLVQWAVAALSFVVVALMVTTSSRAAFVAQNENTGNQISSAVIDLADNDNSTAMFDVGNLRPGVSEVRCIQVAYTGNVDPTPVRLYRAAVPTADLAPYLNLTVEIGPAIGPAFSGCTGFSVSGTEYAGTLADFAATRTGYGDAAAVTTWDPAATGETRTFRFTVSVQDVAAAEGKSTNFGFSWETRTS